MSELLAQGAYLTWVGMGMTFLSLGALVVGMYLMTHLIQDTPPSAAEVAPAPAPVLESAPAPDPTRYLAAAAAVAVALEQASSAHRPTPGNAGMSARAWTIHMRGRQLTQRQQHAARRRL